jgi:uncharacterized protein (TIGR03083 family)
MHAADVLKYGNLTLLGSVEGLAPDDWETPGVCGVWSVKGIVAHLASYEAVLVEILDGFVGGNAPTPLLDRFRDPGANFNDAEVAARASRSVEETLAELKGAHARVLELIAEVPEDLARRTGTLPWYGEAYALEDLLVYMYYGHKREHAAQILVFRDGLARV